MLYHLDLQPRASTSTQVRDPRDVMVSLYYHSRSITGISYQGSWDEWFEDFLAGRAPLPMAAPRGDAGARATDAGARAESRPPPANPNDWFEHTLTLTST